MTKKSPKKKTLDAPRKHAAGKPVGAGKIGPIKKQLLIMREDLMKTVRNQQISEASIQDNGDSVDQASQSIEKELLFELSDNERMTLDQIEAALRKIDKGTYGLCEACQKSIPAPRLKALPFARYCITCQSTSESAPELVENAPDFRAIGEETTSREA
jgi:DnaK suppressor protein